MFNGQDGRNWVGPVQPGKTPRGQSALDVVIESGYLTQLSSSLDFANWLREPVLEIIADVNTYVDGRFTFLWAPFVASMEGLAAAAGVSALSASNANISAVAANVSSASILSDVQALAALIAGGVLAGASIFGLKVSNSAVDADNDITVTSGQCRDSTNAVDIVLSASRTKRLDAVWVVGDNQGGRTSATVPATGASWHVHAVRITATTAFGDIILDPSPTAPTLPATATHFRRIGSLPRLGWDATAGAFNSTKIPAFTNYGSSRVRTMLKHPQNEYSGQVGSAAAQLKDFYVPLGIKVEPIIYAQANNDGTTALLNFTDPDRGIPNAYGSSDQVSHIRLSTNEKYIVATVQDEATNTAGQLYVFPSNAGMTWAAKTKGWVDDRAVF